VNWQGGPIRQNGFVVTDIHEAMDYWISAFGVGPFFHIQDQPVNDFRHRGEQQDLRISVALAQSGGIQIELIQPLDDSPNAFTEFAGRGQDGLQHVAYWTTDFDSVTAEAERRGLTLVQCGRSGSGAPNERFAYYETSHPAAPLIEISEAHGRKSQLFSAVAQAAADWDGTDPIRDMAVLLS